MSCFLRTQHSCAVALLLCTTAISAKALNSPCETAATVAEKEIRAEPEFVVLDH